MAKLDVEFALVSVRKGRADVRKAIEAGQETPITLTGVLIGVWGRSDGIDQEFEMRVDKATALKPRKRKSPA